MFTLLVVRALLALGALIVLAWIGGAAASATPQVNGPDAGGGLSSAVSPITEPDAGATSSTHAPSSPAHDAAPTLAEVPAPATARAIPTGPASGRASPERPVVLNTATESDLRRLPGVGAKRADAILALRKKLGRFQRLEDLLRVKGIGRAAMRKWRPVVRMDPAPEQAADGGAP